MSDLVTFQNGIVTGLAAALAPLNVRDCATHHGRFDQATLKKYALKAPAVRVAALGIPEVAPYAGQIGFRIAWAAYVITRDTNANGVTLGRDAAALAIIQQIVQTAKESTWAVAGVDTTEQGSLAADNLWSDDAPELGIALWAVTWRQGMETLNLAETTLASFQLFTQTITDPVSDDTGITQQTTLTGG